jgi:hypothetical protein
MLVHPDKDIFQRSQFGEQADVLVGAGDTGTGDDVWACAFERFTVEDDIAFFRRIEAGYTVEKRCFACTVWANQANDFAFADFEFNRIDGGKAAKAFGQLTIQQDFFGG